MALVPRHQAEEQPAAGEHGTQDTHHHHQHKQPEAEDEGHSSAHSCLSQTLERPQLPQSNTLAYLSLCPPKPNALPQHTRLKQARPRQQRLHAALAYSTASSCHHRPQHDAPQSGSTYTYTHARTHRHLLDTLLGHTHPALRRYHRAAAPLHQQVSTPSMSTLADLQPSVAAANPSSGDRRAPNPHPPQHSPPALSKAQQCQLLAPLAAPHPLCWRGSDRGWLSRHAPWLAGMC
jgi:hypothetical protein